MTASILSFWRENCPVHTMENGLFRLKRIPPRCASDWRTILALIGIACLASGQGAAKELRLIVTPVGPDQVIFDPKTDACDGHDVPDAPMRAYRDDVGNVVAFGLHFENRRLIGPTLNTLKINCRVVFRGTGNSDPKAFDDRSWITATWTPDGRTVHALAHHEFQANTHKGRCIHAEYMKCWWNSILALKSSDSGASFVKSAPSVMAASPEPSEVGQGRHRGFFNPSNIIEHRQRHFTLIGTTGWSGQQAGVCLFETRNISDPASWRAYSGTGLGWRFPDPYTLKGAQPTGLVSCKPIAPFPAPVGSITRHRASGAFVALYQAAAGAPDGWGGTYPRSGFYSATSLDLIHWSAPSLVLETRTLYDNACGAETLRSYPVLLDPAAETRNFEDTGDEAMLFFSAMRIQGCNHTGDRKLIARKLRISAIYTE